ALTHPGICTVYALEEIGDQLFIASEFVDGRTLRAEIGDGRTPSAQTIVETARELAAALASAHAKGITHRDLKPANVMRTADGRVKILDFGLARVEPAATAASERTVRALATLPGVILGTPAYMAPEQLEGQLADSRTDVFAFGVLMYELVCGTHPFEAGSELAMAARVLHSEARALDDRCPQVPPSIVQVVDRCLRKVPAERYASAAEIVTAIDRDVPVPPRRNVMWWRTHQLAVMALYVIAATIGWKIKETHGGTVALWLFVTLGITGAIAGIIRGHLLFTDRMNRRRFASELRRAKRTRLAADLVIAASLLAD